MAQHWPPGVRSFDDIGPGKLLLSCHRHKRRASWRAGPTGQPPV